MPESTIVIEELAGSKRTLELAGGGLPLRGANWGRQQRVVTTWFPGNGAEASQQVLGPVEMPSEWEGTWNTLVLVGTPCNFDGADITRASTLRDVLDDICGAGSLLRVTWVTEVGGLTRRLVREGRLTELDCPHDRADDIRWKATFEWTGRGQHNQRVVAFRTDSTAAQVQAQIQALDDLVASIEETTIDLVNGVPGAADSFSLGDLEALANYPNELMKQVSQLGKAVANRARHLSELIQKVRGMPAGLAGQAVDVATNAIAVANQFVDAMSQPSPETLSTEGKVSRMLQAANYFNGAVTQAGYVVDAAITLRVAALQRQRASHEPEQRVGAAGTSDVLAVHVARVGDTLQKLSKGYYGTPDLATAIAQANALPGYQVTVERGTVLVIPTLKNAKALLQG